MTLKEEYARLAADIKEHITQEHTSGEWLSSDAETYGYFKQYAMQSKQPAQQLKPPLITQPSVPVKSVVHAVIKAPTPTLVEKKPEPTKPEIPSEVKKEEKQPLTKSAFQPAPLSPVSPADLSDIRKIVQEVHPYFPIIDQVPSDTPEVVIVVPEESPFITNLARAIDILLAPTAIVRNVPPNSKLKLVISSTSLEIPHLLFDPSLYLKDPFLKAQLWKEIATFLIKI